MKSRLNILELVMASFLAVWQVVSVRSAWSSWAAGSRTSAVLDLLLPTVLLSFNLMTAARLRGHSFGWGTLALLGPVGVAAVYRCPLRVVPAVPALPVSRFEPNGLAVVFPVVQVIVAFHTVITYPWDRPFQWAGDLYVYLIASVFVMAWAGKIAADRGYSRRWGALGLLGPIGLAVAYFLPDRTLRPARGILIEPVRPTADGS